MIQFKLKGKILSGFIVVILIFMVLWIYTLGRIKEMSLSMSKMEQETSQFDEVVASIDNLQNKLFPSYKMVGQLEKQTVSIRELFSNTISDEDIENQEEIKNIFYEVKNLVRKIFDISDSASQKEIKVIEKLFQDYIDASEKAINIFFTEKRMDSESILLAGSHYKALNDKIRKFSKQKEDNIISHMNDVSNLNRKFKTGLFSITKDMQTRIKKLKNIIPVISLICLALGTIIVILITHYTILKPLKRVIDRLKDIAEGEGDLTKRLNVDSNDEIGELGKWFNVFVEKLNAIIVTIFQITEEVSITSQQMTSIAGQSANGAQKQSDKITQVATSMDEMSSTILDVADNAVLGSEAAQKAMEIASSGGDLVSQAVEGMTNLEKTVQSSASIVKVLGESSKQISEIVSFIDEIAEQTNLLALNAAIEAARAGEHGRGFAVVADEVRKLAERTSKAVKKIESIIQTFKSDTQQAVSSMESGTKEVMKGSKLINQAGCALTEIIERVKVATEKSGMIAIATKAQSETSEEISKNAESVLQVTIELTDTSKQSLESAKNLNLQFIELKKMVSHFNVD